MVLSTADHLPPGPGTATDPAKPLARTNGRSRRRRAATAMEYLVALSLIFIVAMIAINALGETTKGSFQKSGSTIEKATKGHVP